MIMLTRAWKDGYGQEHSESIMVNPVHIVKALKATKGLDTTSEHAKTWVVLVSGEYVSVTEELTTVFSLCKRG